MSTTITSTHEERPKRQQTERERVAAALVRRINHVTTLDPTTHEHGIAIDDMERTYGAFRKLVSG